MKLREAGLEDVGAIARIRREIYPYRVESLAAQRRSFELMPERAHAKAFVAEVDGEIVGFARALLNYSTSQEGAGILGVNVLASHRRQGIGSELLSQAASHLHEIGASVIRVWGQDGEATAAFAAKHGFEQAREMRYSKVDLGDLRPMPEIPSGVSLATVEEVGIDAVYEFDCVAALDEPGDVPHDNMPKQEWVSLYWESPDHRADLGIMAIVDGVVAAGTFVEADFETRRSVSAFTGTLPGYRGRGLAKLVKSESLRRLAEAGITAAYTSNDGVNGPMLAVNTWLGYTQNATERSFTKR